MFKFTGTIKVIQDTQKISDKFQKREFVVTDTTSMYPQDIMFQATQDKCNMLDQFQVNDSVEVSFNLRGREWTSPQGEVKYFNENLLDLEIEERAHKGIFLAFQYPLEIPGVNTNIFLKTSLNAIKKAKGEKELDAIEFLKLVKQKAGELKFDEKILSRQLNVGFSGGEKKKNEILQMSILNPKLSIALGS